jgi:hypothetical protein
MCSICDGASHDDVLAFIHHHVRVHGWALQGVIDEPPDQPGWTYSIGLALSFGHPELVVVGGGMEVGGSVINDLGERIRRGRRFRVGDEVAFPPGPVTFAPVHPIHLERGLMASWQRYTELDRRPVPPLDALQVVLPELECSCGVVHETPLLADPAVCLVGGPSRRRPTDRLPSYRPATARRGRRRR